MWLIWYKVENGLEFFLWNSEKNLFCSDFFFVVIKNNWCDIKSKKKIKIRMFWSWFFFK
jgi:hypothetical protein